MRYYYRKYDQDSYIEPGHFRAAFGLSVVGAGGKTTLIKALADEYDAVGKRVYLTTTTHIRKPNEHPVYYTDELSDTMQLCDFYPDENIIYVAAHDRNFSNDQKLTAPEAAVFQNMFHSGCPVLIEADGSKQLPCKVPAEHEPVILEKTDTVIGVLSSTAIHRTIKDCCHRPQLTAVLLEKTVTDEIELQDLVKIAFSDKGLKKSVQDTMDYFAVINDWKE